MFFVSFNNFAEVWRECRSCCPMDTGLWRVARSSSHSSGRKAPATQRPICSPQTAWLGLEAGYRGSVRRGFRSPGDPLPGAGAAVLLFEDS